MNVTGASPGSTIGTCGANIVDGFEEAGRLSSVHAVSSDGLRVFFEAVPGSDCSEPKHLYMRLNAESTVDLGNAEFVAANAEGTQLLLARRSGESREIVLYDTETATEKTLFSVQGEVGAHHFKVSEDLSTIYFMSGEHLTPDAPAISSTGSPVSLYRYDVPAEKLTFIDALSFAAGEGLKVSADGRYLYFEANECGGGAGRSARCAPTLPL